MALVGFLMVPYYLGEFGLATYAIIPLIISITTYFLAMSDSLADAFTRYTAISVQNGDPDAINRTFTSSVIGMTRCILILAPLVAILSVGAPYLFNTGEASNSDVQIAFFLVIMSTLLISFSACMGSVFMAYNKMYITYLGRIVHCVLQVGLVLLFFFIEGPSLMFIGVSYMVAAVVFLAIMALNLRRVCPTICLSRRFYDRDLLKKMGSLGIWAVIAEMGVLLFIQASMIVVNLMIGSEAQGSFSIAANMISMVNTACTSVSAAVIPLIYRCYANGNMDEMVCILRVFTKFTGLLMAFPIAYVIVFAPQVLDVWLGSGYDDMYGMLYIMLPIEVAVCVSSPLLCIPTVYARLRRLAMATMTLGLFNVVLAAVLIKLGLGVTGACMSWVVSMAMLKLVFYPAYASKLTSGTLTKYVGSLTVSYSMFAVLLLIGFLVSGMFTLPTSWIAIFVSFFIPFGLYFVAVMRFLFGEEEKELISTFLPGFVQRFLEGKGRNGIGGAAAIHMPDLEFMKTGIGRKLLLIIVVGLAARYVVGIFFTYPTDVNYWVIVAENLMSNEGLYGLPGYYYTPVWGYIMSLVTAVTGLLGIQLGEYVPELVGSGMILDWTCTLPTFGYAMLIKTVLFAVDLLVAAVLFRIGKVVYGEDKALWMFAIWFLCPFTIIISSIRMMFENVEILFLLLSLLCMIERRPAWAGVMMAMSLMTKPYGVFLCLLMIGYSYAQSGSVKYTSRYFLALAVTGLILFMPIVMSGQVEEAMMWLTNRMGSSSSDYNKTLDLMPFVLLASVALSLIIAVFRVSSLDVLFSATIILTSIVLFNPGNIQYYLVLLPLVLLLFSRALAIPLVCFLILSVCAFISFSTWSSTLYIHGQFFGYEILRSFVAALYPIDSTLSYNWFKSVTAYSVLAVPIIYGVRRWHSERC